MPVTMNEYIQSVQINDTMYVGGGWTDRLKHTTMLDGI